MNLTKILAIEKSQPAEYRWVAEHTEEPRFVLEQRAGFPTLYAAYLAQVGFDPHSGYEAVFYERRSEADDRGRNEWWRLTTSDAIYIMKHEATQSTDKNNTICPMCGSSERVLLGDHCFCDQCGEDRPYCEMHI